MLSIKSEGIHLVAVVRYSNPRPGEPNGYVKIEDDDYNSKKDFKQDLKANGYTVRSIWDNRDMYVIDHSEYGSLSIVSDRIAKLKRMIKYYENDPEYRSSSIIELYKEDLEKLIDLYNDAIKVDL